MNFKKPNTEEEFRENLFPKLFVIVNYTGILNYYRIIIYEHYDNHEGKDIEMFVFRYQKNNNTLFSYDSRKIPYLISILEKNKAKYILRNDKVLIINGNYFEWKTKKPI